MRQRQGRFVTALLGGFVALMVAAPGALAADTIYWSNYNGTTLSFANLDNTGGGGDLSMTGATVEEPYGVAIDAAAGHIYWANDSGSAISVANLDGSGAHDLTISGVTVNFAEGVAIDPAAGRLYWANAGSNTISFANLDGSGAADLNVGAATVSSPDGVAIDPASGRIYWANASGTHPISYANLDNTGAGADLNVGAAPFANPLAPAIDAAGGKIYWANQSGGSGSVSYAKLDESGGGSLDTTPATVSSPQGVAIDPEAGLIYWANFSGGISFANLNNTGGGGNLDIDGSNPNGPTMPALLRAPKGAGPPVISGGSVAGSTLSCSQATWAPDLLASKLYRVPQSFSYSWSRDGTQVPGANASTITASSPGSYSCRVMATNYAGSTTSQESDSHTVVFAPNAFTIGKPKLNRKRGTAKLPVSVPGAGTLTLGGKGVMPQRTVRRAAGAANKAVAGAGTVNLLVKAKGKTKKTLNKKGKVKVKPKITFTPTGGSPNAQTKTIKLKKKLH
jgi:DNA-binding beta-propeller fold protein YncE